MKRSSLFSGIARNVFILGVVSFLTDVSSDMIYPLLPIFLTSVLGAGPAFLGLIEGAAESVAAFLKLASGIWSDRVRDRSRLVLFGYTLSSFSRPLVAIAQNAPHVLMIRISDRIGKGVRNSPRDAIIADSVEPQLRGKAYGFQRSMDNAGAFLGPLLATGLLAAWVKDLRTLFLWAAVPGFLAVFLILIGVREVEKHVPQKQKMTWSLPHGHLRNYLLILFLFTLGNSTDAFLLLKAGQLGVPMVMLPILWTLFHGVKMISVMPLGSLSDRLGRRNIILCGWAVLAVTYVGFVFAHHPWHAWALFAFYGLFYGFTEGTERALLVDLSRPEERGSAFGWFHFVIGMAALPASLVFGMLWQKHGSGAAFSFGAALAFISVLLLGTLVPADGHKNGAGHV